LGGCLRAHEVRIVKAWITAGVLFVAVAGTPADAFSLESLTASSVVQNRMAWAEAHASARDCDAFYRSMLQRSRLGPSSRRVERERCRDATATERASVRPKDTEPLVVAEEGPGSTQ
jgi:hypothetical protein